MIVVYNLLLSIKTHFLCIEAKFIKVQILFSDVQMDNCIFF